MGSTLTIRNLDDDVKKKLRLRAALHQNSMEAEARAILARAVEEPEASSGMMTPAEIRQRINSVAGIWKDRGTTDELMALTRGED